MRDRNEGPPLSIGSAVRFIYRGKTIHGHVLEQQGRRRFAKVIDAEQRTWRVPEAVLTASGEARRATMVTHHDEARAAWRVGDEVTFSGAGGSPRSEMLRGKIVKLNPKKAKVRCGDACWAVPYALLHATEGKNARNGAERLNAVAAMARVDGRARALGLDPRLRRGRQTPWRLQFSGPHDPYQPCPCPGRQK